MKEDEKWWKEYKINIMAVLYRYDKQQTLWNQQCIIKT